MRKAIAIVMLTGMFGAPAMAQDFQYNSNSAQLPDGSLVVANIVRQPAFTGEKDEQVQAMDQAKTKLDADYCTNKGGEFVADPGLIVFDKGVGEWMIGGVCQ